MENKKEKIEDWEGKIYDFLSPINLTMFREERTEKVILFIKELLKSEKEKDCQELLEKIKLEYDEPINRDTKWITKEQSNYWADGYNKAVEDLEKIKKELND